MRQKNFCVNNIAYVHNNFLHRRQLPCQHRAHTGTHIHIHTYIRIYIHTPTHPPTHTHTKHTPTYKKNILTKNPKNSQGKKEKKGKTPKRTRDPRCHSLLTGVSLFFRGLSKKKRGEKRYPRLRQTQGAIRCENQG